FVWEISKPHRSRSRRHQIQYGFPQRLRNGARPMVDGAEPDCPWAKIPGAGDRLTVAAVCDRRTGLIERRYNIWSKIRIQFPRRSFSISASLKPRSINLRVRFRACEWLVRS